MFVLLTLELDRFKKIKNELVSIRPKRRGNLHLKLQLRKHTSILRHENRNLSRTQQRLSRNSDKIKSDMHQSAMKGNIIQTKMLAKQLVQIHRQMGQSMTMSSQISSVSLQSQAVYPIKIND